MDIFRNLDCTALPVAAAVQQWPTAATAAVQQLTIADISCQQQQLPAATAQQLTTATRSSSTAAQHKYTKYV